MDIKTLFENSTLDEIDSVIDQLKDLYNEKFNQQFRTIKFSNYNGNVCYKIKKDFGFEGTWSGNSGNIGRITVVVPIEKYTVELEEDIRKEYDSFYDQWVKDGRSYNG